MEEALLLADELAVMQDGRLIAHGRPGEVLARDAGPAVRHLFGEQTLAFHRLGTLPAAGAARLGEAAAAPLLPEGATLKQALMLMLEHGTDQLAMPGGGALHLSDILAAA
ncbi:hypothetical protein ACFQU7_13845 [Pseudoroseomonas wenyumeiae]